MKVLVRGTNWIGDAVMSIPAARALRQLFPEAHIGLYTRPWAKGILEDTDVFDEIISFDNELPKFSSVIKRARELRKYNFDLAVLFTNSFQSALVAKLARVKQRFGYATEGRSFLLTNAVPVPPWKNERHEVFYYLELITEIEKSYFNTDTIKDLDLEPKLEISDEKRECARRILAEHGVDLSQRTVALAAGSTNSRAKRWGVERYAKLNDLLQADAGVNVVLLGSTEEAEISRSIFDQSNPKPLDLTGQTSLTDVAGILSEVDLLISNDMGLAHLAPAVGTETLIIFGPTNPVTTRPMSKRAEIIRAEGIECSPCMLRDCPIDHRCMTRIPVEEVFEKALSKLQKF